MAENKGGWFSVRQKKTIAAGVTVTCVVSVVLFVLSILWLSLSFLSRISVVVLPLLVAFFLSILFRPYFEKVKKLVGGRTWLAQILFFLSLLIPVGLVLFFFGQMLVSQFLALIEYLPKLVQQIYHAMTEASPAVQSFIAKYGLAEKIPLLQDPSKIVAGWVSEISIETVGSTAWQWGKGTIQYFASLFGWFIVPIYLAYFLTMRMPARNAIERYLPFCKPETRQDVSYLLNRFVEILLSYVRGQVIVISIQGVLFGLGFWAIGLPYGLLIGLALGALNLIPYLGNLIGLAVTLPIAFFGEGGGGLRLALVVAVFCLVQTLDGYWITPKIQGQRTKLGPVTIVFSMLFWGVVFQGLLGIFLSIPLTAFVVVLWDLLKRKYISEVI